MLDIRLYGDPVLREVTKEVTEIDGALVQLVDKMVATMYAGAGSQDFEYEHREAKIRTCIPRCNIHVVRTIASNAKL